MVGEHEPDLSAVARRHLAVAAGLERRAWVWRERNAVLVRIATHLEEAREGCVVVAAVGGAHGWRFVLVGLLRELLSLLLCSETGVKAVWRIWSEKVAGVMRMPVESGGAMVSTTWIL